MTRLFVDPVRLGEDQLVISEEDHRYLTRVLRLAVGDPLVLFDGEGIEADARVTRMGPRAVELKVEARRRVAPSDRPEVILLQALAKGDKLELIIQKATELGVARILPVVTARAVARPHEGGAVRALSKIARWQKIAREAARQSGRADVPEVEPVSALEVALRAAPRDALKILFWEGARQERLRGLLPAEPVRRVVIAIGPEGGFTNGEVEAARAAGFLVAGLGPRTLRTETAALAVLAILGYVLGDLG